MNLVAVIPKLYGKWVAAQGRDAKRQRAQQEGDHVLARSPRATGDPLMKQAKSHSGDFVCPQCCIEYHLIAEQNLRCDSCRGPLVKGTLDDLWSDEEDASDGA